MNEETQKMLEQAVDDGLAAAERGVIFRDLLITLITSKDFGAALLAYFDALGDAGDRRVEADSAYALALLGADAKNDAGRKAQADISASTELLAACEAEARASVLRHLVLHLRADRGTLEILEGKAER